MSSNHRYFTIGQDDSQSFHIPSLTGMIKYDIVATMTKEGTLEQVRLFKCNGCYLGIDVSCNILEASKINISVHDGISKKIGNKEITGDVTIREAVLDIISNENMSKQTTVTTVYSEVEDTAEEQD